MSRRQDRTNRRVGIGIRMRREIRSITTILRGFLRAIRMIRACDPGCDPDLDPYCTPCPDPEHRLGPRSNIAEFGGELRVKKSVETRDHRTYRNAQAAYRHSLMISQRNSTKSRERPIPKPHFGGLCRIREWVGQHAHRYNHNLFSELSPHGWPPPKITYSMTHWDSFLNEEIYVDSRFAKPYSEGGMWGVTDVNTFISQLISVGWTADNKDLYRAGFLRRYLQVLYWWPICDPSESY